MDKNKDYMYSIIVTKYAETLRKLIKNAKTNKSIIRLENEDKAVEMLPQIKDVIIDVLRDKIDPDLSTDTHSYTWKD